MSFQAKFVPTEFEDGTEEEEEDVLFRFWSSSDLLSRLSTTAFFKNTLVRYWNKRVYQPYSNWNSFATHCVFMKIRHCMLRMIIKGDWSTYTVVCLGVNSSKIYRVDQKRNNERRYKHRYWIIRIYTSCLELVRYKVKASLLCEEYVWKSLFCRTETSRWEQMLRHSWSKYVRDWNFEGMLFYSCESRIILIDMDTLLSRTFTKVHILVTKCSILLFILESLVNADKQYLF